MSSGPATHEDFPDLDAHKHMWTSYTHLIVRSIIAIIIGVLFIGFVTGTL